MTMPKYPPIRDLRWRVPEYAWHMTGLRIAAGNRMAEPPLFLVIRE